jgi:hypothetical protein
LDDPVNLRALLAEWFAGRVAKAIGNLHEFVKSLKADVLEKFKEKS